MTGALRMTAHLWRLRQGCYIGPIRLLDWRHPKPDTRPSRRRLVVLFRGVDRDNNANWYGGSSRRPGERPIRDCSNVRPIPGRPAAAGYYFLFVLNYLAVERI